MAAVPQRWLNPEGDVIAYSDEAGALYVRDGLGEFSKMSDHGQIGGPEDGPDAWLVDEDEEVYDFDWDGEPDPAEEDPVLTSIVMAIPEDVNAIYILTQRLAHVLYPHTVPSREADLAWLKLKEAAMWLGAAIHAGGVADDG